MYVLIAIVKKMLTPGTPFKPHKMKTKFIITQYHQKVNNKFFQTK